MSDRITVTREELEQIFGAVSDFHWNYIVTRNREADIDFNEVACIFVDPERPVGPVLQRTSFVGHSRRTERTQARSSSDD